MKLLFASHNRGKVTEVSRLLAESGWQVLCMADMAGDVELIEDGSTFRDNAQMKARQAFELFRGWTLADDSGLEVDALDGEPGVYSARYAGPDATDADRVEFLLKRMAELPETEPTARFCCVMCLIDPTAKETFFEGKVAGTICRTPRGSAGFGYDPIFIPEGEKQTFAELGLDVKNRISHRALATAAVVRFLKEQAVG